MFTLETSSWIGITSILFFILCFYFTLSFIEGLHKGKHRISKQYKAVAIGCLIIALLVPALYSMIF